MIDPHVHFRDWNQSHKETIAHGLMVAEKAGLSAVHDVLNTDPLGISRDLVVRRIDDARKIKSPVKYMMYVLATKDEKQVAKCVDIVNEFPDHVAGIKAFTENGVELISLSEDEDIRMLYRTLANKGYTGVVSIHPEEKSLMQPLLWDPESPITHCIARPEIAETYAITKNLRISEEEGFRGKIHFMHVSVPRSVFIVDQARKSRRAVFCGTTPAYCLLNMDMMRGKDGILLKVNPALRSPASQSGMLELLYSGMIDWIETDHAPHTLEEKIKKHMSGFPNLTIYPHFINYLRKNGMSEGQIKKITHDNICEAFGYDVPEMKIKPDYDLHRLYPVDAWAGVRERM